MCGIVGYIGQRDACGILLDGLKRLEYRGYDSAGVGVVADGQLNIRKTVGKLRKLETELNGNGLAGPLGLGHTRWATHGKPSVENSHPHLSCDGRIAVVHNGILENYVDLRSRLRAEGHTLVSDTDTETMAHLVETYYGGDLLQAVRRAVRDVEGAFAFGVICADNPDEMVAVRRFSPLVVGIGAGENYMASDMAAIRVETDRAYILEEDQIAHISRDGIELYDSELTPVERHTFVIPWAPEAADKGGHDHFMHKEIHEQPMAMRTCLATRLVDPDEPIRFDELDMTPAELRSLRRIILTGCGTAYHAGMVGRCLMEKLARIPAETDLASELRTRDLVASEDTLCMVVSQSGETADSLAALREVRASGAKILSVLNVIDSSIDRESDAVAYIHAGPEIGVASTKAYTLQIVTMALLALHFAEVRESAPPEVLRELKATLLSLPEQTEELLRREADIEDVATRYYDRRSSLYIGRGINLASAMEGALKLKEISYIHAEA
ncbi:MAG: glutamine--fructose-6-phosphate transaminase (isomerizing), partial [Armatimonadota bacterium]